MLERVNLSPNGDEFSSLNPDYLKKLSLCYMALGDKELEAIANHLKNLTFLRFDNSTHQKKVTLEGVKHLKKMSGLKVLYISVITPFLAKCFPHLPEKLEGLSIATGRDDRLYVESVDELATLPKTLRSLSVDFALDVPLLVALVGGLCALEELAFFGFFLNGVDFDEAKKRMEGLPCIKRLFLFGWQQAARNTELFTMLLPFGITTIVGLPFRLLTKENIEKFPEALKEIYLHNPGTWFSDTMRMENRGEISSEIKNLLREKDIRVIPVHKYVDMFGLGKCRIRH